MDYSFNVIIPVYNEEGNVRNIISKIKESFSSLNIKNYKIIIVEDGSTDNTKIILKSLQSDRRLKILNDKNRLGYTNSLIKAVKYADKDFIFFLDADGQHDPSDFSIFLSNIDKKIIIGFREKRNDSFLRLLLHKIARKFLSIFTKIYVKDASCGFILIERKLIKKLSQFFGYSEGCYWWEFSILISHLRLNYFEVPIKHLSREHGEGFFGLQDIIRLAFKELFTIFKLIIKLKFSSKAIQKTFFT